MTVEPAASDRAHDTRGGGRVDALRRWLFEAPLWQLTAAGFVVSLILFGYRYLPHIDMLVEHTQDPWHVPEKNQTVLSPSPLLPMISWALGITSVRVYAFMHFVVLVGAVYSIGVVTARYVGDLAGRCMIFAFLMSPLANVTLSWLGYPDPITIAAATFLMVGPTWLVGLAAGVIGFNHFEQGAIISLFALVLRPGRRTRIATIVGIAVGRAILFGYHAAGGFPTTGRGDFIAWIGLDSLIGWTVHNWPTALWSVYAVLWVPVIAAMRRVHGPQRRWIIELHVVAAIATTVTTDTTRVFAMLTWPFVVWIVQWWTTNDSAAVKRWVPYLLAAAIVIPRVNVWFGGVYVR